MTTLKDIWTVYYYNSSKQVHKVIKTLFDYHNVNYKFASLYRMPSSSSSSSSSSHYNATITLKASTSPPFSPSNSQAFDHHPGQKGGGGGQFDNHFAFCIRT